MGADRGNKRIYGFKETALEDEQKHQNRFYSEDRLGRNLTRDVSGPNLTLL